MVQIQPNEIVSTILTRYPATAAVFLQLHLGCIGCSMAGFCTLADVAVDYEIDLNMLLQALQNSITQIEAKKVS